MRRTPQYFAFAGLEFARYFALVYAAGSFVTASPSAPQVLRIIAAPNALFAIAFVFMGLDPNRYGVYKPLLIVGKLAALFSGIIALPRLLGIDSTATTNSVMKFTLLGIVVWDAISATLLALPTKTRLTEAAPAEPEPERVEID